MNRKQRDKNRATALALHYKCPPTRACPNCGEKTHYGHFVPLSYRHPGGWICSSASKETP